MLKYKVLANQLTSLADARFFAAHEVDWVSFLLTPGLPESIASADLTEIKNWIQGPAVVGRFINPTQQEIKEAISRFGLDGILLDMDTPLGIIQDGFSATIFKEIDSTTNPDWARILEWSAPFVDYFVLKIPAGINDNKLIIKELCETYDILLENKNNDLSPQLIREFQPTGITVNAVGKEEVVGIKSFEELDTLFEFLQDEPI